MEKSNEERWRIRAKELLWRKESWAIWWVWLSFQCNLYAAAYNTVSIQSQPIINVLEGQNSADRVRELSVECLRLRVFKSLATSHATAMCMHQYTCRAGEYWGERTRGMANRRGGGAHRGEGQTQQQEEFPCCWTSLDLLLMTLSTWISRREFYTVRDCFVFIKSPKAWNSRRFILICSIVKELNQQLLP